MSHRVIALDEIDSTNSEALRRAAAGERGPVWITARRQSRGRGRSGRSWTADEGNLAATLLLRPGCEPAVLYQLALVTGVAVHEAVAPCLSATLPTSSPARAHATPVPRLKWPNDILVGRAKLGGILIESSIFAGETMAAIGIGLNIVSAPVIADRDTTCLADHVSPPPDRARLLQTLADAMADWLGHWRAGAGFDDIRAGWLHRAGPIGEPVSINTGTDVIAGLFVGIDEGGALLLQGCDGLQGPVRRFTFGDVTLMPSAGPKD